MKNYKMENNLVGKENWPEWPTVFVEGDSSARELPQKGTEEEREEVVQTWSKVAILRAESEEEGQPVKFRVGFYNQAVISYLDHELETDLDFGMRIGEGDVNFFVFPVDLKSKINLKLIEKTMEDDPKYPDLPIL